MAIYDRAFLLSTELAMLLIDAPPQEITDDTDTCGDAQRLHAKLAVLAARENLLHGVAVEA